MKMLLKLLSSYFPIYGLEKKDKEGIWIFLMVLIVLILFNLMYYNLSKN